MILKNKIRYILLINIILINFVLINTSLASNISYNVNVGSWVSYTTTEYVRTKVYISGENPISHNESSTYNTKVVISKLNNSNMTPNALNFSFGEIIGSISDSTIELIPRIIQTINNINIGPFLGFFYPVNNETWINQTIIKINEKTFSVYINQNNVSNLPTEIKLFLNPSNTIKIINISANIRYKFNKISNTTITRQVQWYTDLKTFSVYVYNFTYYLNMSGYLNRTFDGNEWVTSKLISKLVFYYKLYIDKITGIVIKRSRYGNIEYYESKSENIMPYYGREYNLSIYTVKDMEITGSNIIIFNISNWVWFLIAVIIGGIIFVLIYVLYPYISKPKKKKTIEGNILED